jgi:hypothetical protein
MTRKDKVLQLLRENLNMWIEGPEIASPQVGGSEGLKRLRELREEGHKIETRPHPNKQRDVWIYRLVGDERVRPGVWTCTRCGETTKDKPEEGVRKSVVENMTISNCWKCKKQTIWRFVSGERL